MPRYEADTLEEAIRKAVRGDDYGLKKGKPFGKPGGKPGGKFGTRTVSTGHLPKQSSEQRRRISGSGFGSYSEGSQISGSGRRGFRTVNEARRAAGDEFERQARRHYPVRARNLDRGSTSDADMMPELGTVVYYYPEGLGPIRYGFDDLFVGGLDIRRARGRVNIPVPNNTVLVLHTYWIDNTPSGGQDVRTRRVDRDVYTDVSQSERARNAVNERIVSYVYLWNGRWSQPY